MDLLEPNHSSALKPYIVDNSLIKSRVENESLVYKNIENAVVKLEEGIYVDQ